MVKRRILALFKIIAIPGWLFFFLEVAEHSELAEYLNEKRHRLWEFAMTPTGHLVSLSCGILWLTAVVLWPELKKYAPRLPKSLHERVHSIEYERIPQCKSEMDSGFSGVWKRCEAMETKVEADVAAVEKHVAGYDFHIQGLRTELLSKIQEVNALLFQRITEDEARITTGMNRADSAHDGMNEQRTAIGKLDVETNKLCFLSDTHGGFLENLQKRIEALERSSKSVS